MALTRKMLKAMGVEDEKIDQIIEAHGETVDALKADRDTYKADADKLVSVQKELDALKAKGNDGYEEKYNKVKADFDAYKADIAAEKLTASKEKAYRELLKAAGVSEKRIDVVMKVSDLSTIELGDDGKIKDADKQTEAVKTEWADFIEHTEEQGADTHNPPDHNGGDKDLGELSMADYIAARKKG